MHCPKTGIISSENYKQGKPAEVCRI